VCISVEEFNVPDKAFHGPLTGNDEVSFILRFSASFIADIISL
jgi:hypothetical protein